MDQSVGCAEEDVSQVIAAPRGELLSKCISAYFVSPESPQMYAVPTVGSTDAELKNDFIQVTPASVEPFIPIQLSL